MFIKLQSVDTSVTKDGYKDIFVSPDRIDMIVVYPSRIRNEDLTQVYFGGTNNTVVTGSPQQVIDAINAATEEYEIDRTNKIDDARRARDNEQHGAPEETDGTVLGVSGNGKDDTSVHRTRKKAAD